MTGERAALNVLLKVTNEDAYLNLALKDGLSGVDRRSVPRLTALLYTALEKLSFCDYYIGKYAKGRIHSSVRGILRLALTELFFMDTPDHAVCKKYVDLTEEIGKAKLKGYVNGVLRSIARDIRSGSLPPLPEDTAERLNVISGYPPFLIDEYVRKYGASFTEEMLSCSLRGMSLRAVKPMTSDELIKRLSGSGFYAERSVLAEDIVKVSSYNGDVAEDELFKTGLMTVQSESAALACVCLDPKPGMNVLDACSAPGGKTAYIFDLMGRSGSLSAWEVHPHRAELTANTMSRLRISGVKCEVRDASVFDGELSESFDRILCDVPCSGLGGGSKPDARLRRTEESIRKLSLVQYSILDTCSGYLKPGGIMVYSTCTISETENESVVSRFLSEHGDFEPAPFTELLPDRLRDRAANGRLTLFPNLDETEGFFIARFRRKA